MVSQEPGSLWNCVERWCGKPKFCNDAEGRKSNGLPHLISDHNRYFVWCNRRKSNKPTLDWLGGPQLPTGLQKDCEPLLTPQGWHCGLQERALVSCSASSQLPRCPPCSAGAAIQVLLVQLCKQKRFLVFDCLIAHRLRLLPVGKFFLVPVPIHPVTGTVVSLKALLQWKDDVCPNSDTFAKLFPLLCN